MAARDTFAVPRPMSELLSDITGLRTEINANGSLRRFDYGEISLLLFVGNELEGGPTNLYLRKCAPSIESTPLIGPLSGTRFHKNIAGNLIGIGHWQEINYTIAL